MVVLRVDDVVDLGHVLRILRLQQMNPNSVVEQPTISAIKSSIQPNLENMQFVLLNIYHAPLKSNEPGLRMGKKPRTFW